ncbi:MAG: hypothetical protein AMXMBFR56_65850 [Polyangiaceae bacterium]
MTNRGAQKLAKMFSVRGSQRRMAESLGIDQGYLSAIASGARVPGLQVRRKLELSARIPMQWWDQPDARKGAA